MRSKMKRFWIVFPTIFLETSSETREYFRAIRENLVSELNFSWILRRKTEQKTNCLTTRYEYPENTQPRVKEISWSSESEELQTLRQSDRSH